MTSVVSLLRGVNVGGHNLIRMEALRAVYERLGLRSPQSYVQSGNIVFGIEARSVSQVGQKIEEAIEREFGFRPEVILRTAEELQSVIARNPFAKRKGIEPGKLLVMFLAHQLSKETAEEARKIKAGPEELKVDGREIYIYFPEGAGRSKLVPVLSRVLKNSGTGRNWNTVVKLSEMAGALQKSR